MKRKNLKLTISLMDRNTGFKVVAEGEAVNNKRLDFYVTVPLGEWAPPVPRLVTPQGVIIGPIPGESVCGFLVSSTIDQKYSPVRTVKEFDPSLHGPMYKFLPGYERINHAIHHYLVTKEEHITLLKFWYPNKRGPRAKKYIPDIDNPYPHVAREALEYFGELIKGILENIGYSVIIEAIERYFPSPTTAGILTPAFGHGLQKGASPVEVKRGYIDTIIFLSHEKPKSRIQAQLNILDNIPEERLQALQRAFKDKLTPYGLKCLYLVIEECNQNNRNPSFALNVNRCLDLMGYTRRKGGVHNARSKTRLLETIETLTRITFNVESRAKKKGKKGAEEVLKFEAPLLSITGKFERWEVKTGEAIESGKKIEDGIHIFLHPSIYNYINYGWYTVLPHEFLKIDTGRQPHAINLYSYIASQWRVGWHQYHGVIRQPLQQILDGSGLLTSFPKRKNLQREYVKKVIDSLKWLKKQNEYWIESVNVETEGRSPINPMVTIAMAEGHPLKESMGKETQAR